MSAARPASAERFDAAGHRVWISHGPDTSSWFVVARLDRGEQRGALRRLAGVAVLLLRRGEVPAGAVVARGVVGAASPGQRPSIVLDDPRAQLSPMLESVIAARWARARAEGEGGRS